MQASNTRVRSEADLSQFGQAETPVQVSSAIRTIADLPNIHNIQAQPIDFMVEGFIARQSVSVIASESGAGKSTLFAAIAAAVSEGTNFAGLKTVKSPVLLVDRENTAPVVLERLAR